MKHVGKTPYLDAEGLCEGFSQTDDPEKHAIYNETGASGLPIGMKKRFAAETDFSCKRKRVCITKKTIWIHPETFSFLSAYNSGEIRIFSKNFQKNFKYLLQKTSGCSILAKLSV